MLMLLVLSATGTLAIIVFAAFLATKPNTRSIGLRIFLVGGVGILLSNIFVLGLNSPARNAFPNFAFIGASLFGFVCAGGVAALVAIVVLVKRKKTERNSSQ